MFAQWGSVFSFISDQSCEEWNGLMAIILTLCDCKHFEVVEETMEHKTHIKVCFSQL